jgi:putative Mg2+ transporter-C (MgtC) family protein
MAAGAGYYLGAVATTAVVLASLIGFRRLRPSLMSRLRSDLYLLDVEMDAEGDFGEVVNVLGRRGINLEAMESEREPDVSAFRLEVRVPPDASLENALREIRGLPGLRGIEARGAGSAHSREH